MSKRFVESEHKRDERGRFAKMSTSELKKRQTIELDEKEDRLFLPDEDLPRSVGARWANYEILLSDGSVAHLQEGSKLHHKEVIAGKGRKRKIDEIDGLLAKYGGNPNEWIKVKAFGTIVKPNGEIEEIEIHWYEEPTAGKVKLKEKV